MNKIESLLPVNIVENRKNIVTLENTLNLKIPESLSLILENYNVAKPRCTLYKKDNVIFNLDYFFGFSEKDYQDIFKNLKTFDKRMPNELFPIARVDGGDLLCMSKENGSIYYWFHEEDDWGLDGNDKWPIMISENLNSFLEFLIPSDEPTQEEIDRAKKQAKITKTTPIALKFKNEARAKKGLPPLTMEDFS